MDNFRSRVASVLSGIAGTVLVLLALALGQFVDQPVADGTFLVGHVAAAVVAAIFIAGLVIVEAVHLAARADRRLDAQNAAYQDTEEYSFDVAQRY